MNDSSCIFSRAILLWTTVLAQSVNALELDIDNKYVKGTLLSASYVEGSSLGFGFGIGAPLILQNTDVIPKEYRDSMRFAVEGAYVNLGSTTSEHSAFYEPTVYEYSASAFYTALRVDYLISPELYFYTNLGLSYLMYEKSVDYDERSVGNDYTDDSESGVKLAAGFGLGYEYTERLTFSAGWDYFGGPVTALSGSVLYNF